MNASILHTKSIVGVLLLAACTAPPATQVAFTIPEPDLIPEGIAYDPVDDAFFVGSTFRRKIVRIDRTGAVRDFTSAGQDGMWGVVGLKVDPIRRILWVASSHAGAGMPMIDMITEDEGAAGVFAYDLTSADLIRRYTLPGVPERHFFNDVVVAADGSVYITDSATNAIYYVAPGADELEMFVQPPDMPSPNGITLDPEERHLFVALRGDVGRVDRATRELTMVARPPNVPIGADGLYFHNGSLVTVWPGEEGHGVTQYTLNASLDTVITVRSIISEHDAFLQPTTGAIRGSDIFVVANSQLQLFRRAFAAADSVVLAQLANPAILRVPLN